MQRLSNFFTYFLVVTIGYVVRHVSLKASLKLGSAVGRIAFLTIKKRRQIALSNLRMIFKDKSEDEINEIAQKSFVHLGKTLVEFLRLPKYDKHQLMDMVKLDGEENLRQAISSGKGILIITAHFGNWELIFHILTFFTDRLSAVAQRFKNYRFDRLVNGYRVIHGGEIIEKANAIRQVIAHLRKGYCSIILSDQDAGNSGIFIDFMGVPASIAKGPVMFAMRTDSIILNVFDIRQDDDSHIISISKPIIIENSGDLQEDIKKYTVEIAKSLESIIYKYPSQWLWMHNRWKTKRQIP
jgi:KDO2-lipid IV(A) lauroyltransferase